MTYKQKYFSVLGLLHLVWLVGFMMLTGPSFSMALIVLVVGLMAGFFGYCCGAKQFPNGTNLD